MKRDPFTEPGERIRLLASLPEPTLLSMIAEQARACNTPWMRVVLDSGLLNGDSLRATAQQVAPESSWRFQERWAARSDACFCFLEAVAQISIGYEDPSVEQPRLMLELPADFRAVCNLILDVVIAELHKWRDVGLSVKRSGAAHASASALEKSMATCAIAAAILDREDAIREVLSLSPGAVTLPVSDTLIGGAISETLATGVRAEVSAYFCALQYSGLDVVKAITSGVLPSQEIYATVDASGKRTAFTLANTMREFRHRCMPGIFSYAARAEADGSATRAASGESALWNSIGKLVLDSKTPESYNRALVPDLIDAGLYDDQPAESLALALQHGNRIALAVFLQRFPHVFLSAAAVVPASAEAEHADLKLIRIAMHTALHGGHHAAVLDLADHCRHAGAADVFRGLVFPLQALDGVSGGNPAHAQRTLTDATLWRLKTEPSGRLVLLHLLEDGLQPSTVMDASGRTLVDRLEVQAPELASLTRAFAARQASRNVLEMATSESSPS